MASLVVQCCKIECLVIIGTKYTVSGQCVSVHFIAHKVDWKDSNNDLAAEVEGTDRDTDFYNVFH